MSTQPQKTLIYYIPEDTPTEAGLRGKTLVARELERLWQSIQILSTAVTEHTTAQRAYYNAARTAKDKDYWLARANASARCAARYRKRESAHAMAFGAAIIN